MTAQKIAEQFQRMSESISGVPFNVNIVSVRIGIINPEVESVRIAQWDFLPCQCNIPLVHSIHILSSERVDCLRKFDNCHETYRYIVPLDMRDSDYAERRTIAAIFEHLDQQMNTLMLELERIRETNDKMASLAEGRVGVRLANFEDRMLLTTLWADYYFFLNTVVRAYELTMALYNRLNSRDKAKRLKNCKEYKSASTVRNSFEHADHRLGKYGADFSRQIGKMRDERYENTISVDGAAFSASEASLDVLYQAYDDISSIILEKYVKPNKKSVDQVFEAFRRSRFAGTIDSEKIIKIVPDGSNIGDGGEQ